MRAISVALVAALVLALAACTKDTQNQSSIQLVDPGHCTPVDVVAAPEVASIVDDLASRFNGSVAAHAAHDKCTVVRVQAIDSATAARELVSGWKNASTYGPAPAIWVPASSAWTALVDQRLTATGQAPVGAVGSSLAQTPLVVAMPAPMAHALGWPNKKVGWNDLAKLAADPRGWAAHGHPEWGAFKLGKTSPELDTSGLLATIATSDLPDTANAALEASVVYYGDSPTAFLGTWDRLDQNKQSPATFASAVVTDERSVGAYNAGHPDGDRRADAQPKPRVPLVAISPEDGAFESDYPVTPVTASWVDDAARPGVAAFTAFARSPESQGKVVAAGFRAGGSADDVSIAAYAHANTDLARWSKLRKKARVMLVVDESDSMGDAADWRNMPIPRIVLAQRALLTTLAQFGPDDEVGLRVFSTDFKGGPSPYWADVVPIRTFSAKQRAALVKGVHNLAPKAGSPLYTAARDSYDALTHAYDAKRINGVVLVTDGYNEVESANNRDALLAHLHQPVRMFTVSFTSDADLKSLRKIAEATNAQVYDATDPKDLASVLPAAVGNF